MEQPMESDVDPSVFGYRWTTAEQHMIFFSRDTTEHLSTSASSSMRIRPPRISQQSILESLSIELLHLTIEYLDLKSLAALGSVDSFMSQVVRSLPAFRCLTKYAPQALKALGHTRLIHRFGVMQLYYALRSTTCSYCNMYGPYLYLLQCKRCCYPCLRRNQRLISIPLNRAKLLLKSFDLESKSLPRLLTLPGTYTYEDKIWKKRLWLVSWDNICSILQNRYKEPRSSQYETSLLHLSQEDLASYQNRFGCHAVVAFPSVTQNGDKISSQHGLWCRGCEENWYFSHRYANYDELKQLYATQETAYSKIEFTEHCKRCSGIKRLKDLNYPNFESVPEYRRYVQRS